MTKQEFKDGTKCPLCKIGFYLMCSAKGKGFEVQHMDILWTSEAGMTADCKDAEFVNPFVVKNEDYGTGYSLNSEVNDIFKQLNEDFLKDPSEFSKDNVDLNTFSTLLGTFFRYSSYMDDHELDSSISDPSEVATELYNSGKNLKEVMDNLTVKSTETNDN